MGKVKPIIHHERVGASLLGRRRPQTGIVDYFNGKKENVASFAYNDTSTIFFFINKNLLT